MPTFSLSCCLSSATLMVPVRERRGAPGAARDLLVEGFLEELAPFRIGNDERDCGEAGHEVLPSCNLINEQ